MARATDEKELKRIKDEKLAQWSQLATATFRIVTIRQQTCAWLARSRKEIKRIEGGKGKEKLAKSTTISEATEILKDVTETMQAVVAASEGEEVDIGESQEGGDEDEEEAGEEEIPLIPSRKIPPLRLYDGRVEAKEKLLKNYWATKFYNKLKKLNMEAERQFNESACQMKEFVDFMVQRGLKKLIKVEGIASWDLMRKILSNLHANTKGEGGLLVLVRGQIVDCTADRIKKILGIEGPFEEDQEEIAECLNLLEDEKDKGERERMERIFGEGYERVYVAGKKKVRSLVAFNKVDPKYHPPSTGYLREFSYLRINQHCRFDTFMSWQR